MRLPKPLLRDKKNVSKKDFGHVLVVAGSASMLGAAVLTSLAAMRSGAGLVTCAISSVLNLTLQKKLSPVMMTLPYKSYSDIKKKFTYFNVIAIGPGLGRSIGTKKIIYTIITDFMGSLVIDADALNLVSLDPSILMKCKAIKILTPHCGEMSRLTGLKIFEIERNRKQVALDFAAKYNCIVVLKGYHTVVASADGKVYINRTGNAGMAKAGMGDVLTGVIAAILAQGVSPFEASKTAVFIHGKAGDLAAIKFSKVGMIAVDVIEELGNVLKK